MYELNWNFPLLQKIEKGELEEVMNEGMNEGYGKEEVCYGKKCTANEHCCSGHACVDVDGGNHKLLSRKQKKTL